MLEKAKKMGRPKKTIEGEMEKELRSIINEAGAARDKVAAIALLKKFIDDKTAVNHEGRNSVTKTVVDVDKLKEVTGFKPHEKQQAILDAKTHEIVVCAGRQAGKSMLCAFIALYYLLHDNTKICLIAPTYELTDRILHYLRIWVARYFNKEIRVSTKIPQKVRTTWGSYIECRSTENPEGILGRGFDLILVDECARISEDVYQTYIVPASGIALGKYFFISTPQGRDWFWRAWIQAKEKGGAFQFSSFDNPYFSKEKLEQERKRLPEFIFRQEYMAEFMESAIVFQRIDTCLDKTINFPQEFNESHLYSVGIDLGKYDDFTAVTVVDRSTNTVVEFQMFQGDWESQFPRIKDIIDHYGEPMVWVDSTTASAGDAYVEQLQSEGYNVTGYKIQSNVSKRQLIEKLVILIQNSAIKIPDNEYTQDLIDQIRAFGFSRNPSGVITYQAPQGLKDDAVLSLALACYELEEQPLGEYQDLTKEIIKFPEQDFE